MDAAASPLPNDERTPPVIKMNFACRKIALPFLEFDYHRTDPSKHTHGQSIRAEDGPDVAGQAVVDDTVATSSAH